jgi:rhamnulose-1-phosphate aldolase
MQSILSSWFVQGMVKATSDMWLKGWDERNGGNISLRLLEDEVAPFKSDFVAAPRHMCSLTPQTAWCCFRSAKTASLIKSIGDW